MAAYDLSDEEDRELRYEQLHGPIMRYAYGCYPPQPTAPPVHEQAETFGDAVSALHGLIGEAASEGVDRALDFPGHEGEEARWEAFSEQVDALTEGHPFRGISLVGPDGWTYWITEIDR